MAVVFDTHPVQYLKLGVGWTRHSHVNSLQVTDDKKKSDRLPSYSNYKLEKIGQHGTKCGTFDFTSVTSECQLNLPTLQMQEKKPRTDLID